MRPLRALLIYILVVFLGGALLAPGLYWLVQLAENSFPKLAHAPFHRYVNRSLIILAIAGLWPLLRSLGARSVRDVGLVAPAGQGKRLCTGFLLGFVSLATLALIALASTARVIDTGLALPKLAEKLLSAALTAAVVATVEEILFRGGIFNGLRRLSNWQTALVASSAIYALVHFLAPVRHQGEITWLSGLVLLPKMLAGFGDWRALLPGFFNLTLAGALLALAYHRTGNLYFSIGLHAGWIFWLKSYGVLTSAARGANPWLWGSDRMIDGWLACAVLTITLALFARHAPAERKLMT